MRLSRLLVFLSLVASGWGVPRPAFAQTITVTTTAEAPGASGDCTLGEAIEAAQTNTMVDNCQAGGADDIIVLQPNATYTLTTGVLAAFANTAFHITSTLTISGQGATLARAEVAGLSLRFFYVAEDGALALHDLTLRGGRLRGTDGQLSEVGDSMDGGAIYNDGVLVLDGVRFEANRVQGGNGGDSDGLAPGGDGGQGNGGALRNAGSLSIVGAGAVFAGNQAIGGAGGAGGGDQSGGNGGQASGGALMNSGSLEATAPVVFEHNQSLGGVGGADGAGKDAEPGHGGGAHGAALTNFGPASLTGAEFSNNAALAGEAGAGPSNQVFGGTIVGAVVNNVADLALADSLIYSNTARGGLGGAYGGAVAGGELMHDFGTLRLTAVRVLSNTAVGGDAAPGANGLGGYVTGTFYVQSGTVQIEQSAFVGNELLPGASETAPGLASGGGLAAFNGTVRITNTTFAGNTATEGAALTTSTPITLTHVTVAHNTSTSGPALRALSPYLWLYNSVVAHNAGGNCDSANQASGTANLQFPGSTCGAGVTVDDPLLAALAEHDGMPYLPLLPGSPARDAAIGYCPSVDQLGAARPLGPACDLGAVEAEGFLFMPFIQR